MIQTIADLHVHTNASQHAYSTLYENVLAAAKCGLNMIANTDHGPALPDSPHIWKISKQYKLPDSAEGVRILRGAEANIVDFNGGLDIPDEILSQLEWVIASLHTYVIEPGTFDQHTACWIEIAENPRVDLIGHCEDLRYDFDHRAVVSALRDNQKILEVNNNSFLRRAGSLDNLRSILKLCIQYQVPVAVNSDAHFCSDVGRHGPALKFLEEMDFPVQLVVNGTGEALDYYLKQYRGRQLN